MGALARRFGIAAKRLTPSPVASSTRRWLAPAILLVVIGGASSFLISRSTAHSDTQSSRRALSSGADAAAAQIRLAILHEEDLELAARAFVVQNPRATQAQFMRWTGAMQVMQRYPEVLGLSFEVEVPASELVRFEREYLSKLPTGANVKPGPLSIVPAGPRPFYCLTKLAMGTRLSLPATLDACQFEPGLAESRDSGGTAAVSLPISTTDVIFALGTPVYRSGRAPSTAAARHSAFLGWTAVATLPDVLLAAAQRGHPGLALTLARGTGAAATRFTVATPPSGATTVERALNNGWTLYIAGRLTGGTVFSDGAALRLLLGGSAFSLLLAAVFFLLATGRQRALRLVSQRTRELAEEVELTATARDAAVEALTAKSTFLATVSHELRTPLAGVIGTADLLLDTPLNEDQEEYAETLSSSAEALLLVINDILDYSKIEAGKLELATTDFSLRELVGECCARMLGAASQKPIALTNLTDSSVPAWLHGDRGRIGQILTNLLSNAIKFTDEGGVTVRTTATVDAGLARVRVEMIDTGIGIDEGMLKRLFTPFTQADASTARRFGGTGLGLTISAELVELMGGRISAQSEPGVGSTFWFELVLPVASAGGITIKTHDRFAALGERDERGKLTDGAPIVLVAEDNPVNQMLAARMLDKCGYRSEVVPGGEQALAALAAHSFAAILMDCQMPGMDGYEATRVIRRRENGGGRIPIIAVTAHSLAGDREKCLTAGMDAYVSKPLRASELRAVLERSIRSTARPAAR